MYHELLYTSLILNFFDSLLTGLMAFAAAYTFVYFYRFSIYVGIGFATIFFVRSLVMKIKQNKILMIEDKYPDLKERLRTSYDYQKNSNTVIDSLHHDIESKLAEVDVNAFLNMKKIAGKVFITGILLFGVLYFASVGLDIVDIKNRVVHSALFDKIKDVAQGALSREHIQDRPLLKDPSLIDLGDKEMNLSIKTYNTELDISEVDNPEKNDYGGHYPEEIEGAAQEVYESGIPEEHKEVIKEYFKKISE